MDLDRDGAEGEPVDDVHHFTVKMTMDFLRAPNKSCL
jgi:hypothetical protein